MVSTEASWWNILTMKICTTLGYIVSLILLNLGHVFRFRIVSRMCWRCESETRVPSSRGLVKQYNQGLILNVTNNNWPIWIEKLTCLKKAPSHTVKSVRDTSEALSWEVLPRAAYSPDLAPSDYHLFASIGHALAEKRFGSYEDVKKWLMNISQQRRKIFTDVVFTNCPKTGKMNNKRWNILWIKHFLIILPNLTCFLEKESALHTCSAGIVKLNINFVYFEQ